MTGRQIDAQEAWRIGLVNHVVPPRDVMPKAEALARKIAANGPVAVQRVKETVMRASGLSLEDGYRIEDESRRIVFASNMADPEGRNFDLYLIDLDGSNLTQITFHPELDAFPMFSSDGSKLVWGSNRHGAEEGDTNVFVADWVGPR